MVQPWNTPADALNRLLRRCVECPPDVQPSCPTCASDEACTLKPADCNNCASMICIKVNALPGQQLPSSSPPIGGIVGGVVGGIVVITTAIFLVWFFRFRRKKRRDLWEPTEKASDDPAARALTRHHSIASTLRSRASNVIQIAYIPGVQVRSAPESPEIPPPMPSIPSTYAARSNQSTPDVERFFLMPKRDSVRSETSSIAHDPRVSITPSLLQRETIWQENDVVPPMPTQPAQYAQRVQVNAVNVSRSGSNTPSIGTSGNSTPVQQNLIQININSTNNSQVVARNVTARPIELKKTGSGSSGQTLTAFPRKSASRRATPAPTISDEKEVFISSPSIMSMTMSDSPLLASSAGARMQKPSLMSVDGTSISSTSVVMPAEGPLGSATHSGRPTTAYAQQMIHEAIFRATQDSSHAGLNSTAVQMHRPEPKKHDSGPFSDSNESNEYR